MTSWQPINKWRPEYADQPFKQVLFWGRPYGQGDTPEQIERNGEGVFILQFYDGEGVDKFASTETYWDGQWWYVKPSRFAIIDLPDGGERR